MNKLGKYQADNDLLEQLYLQNKDPVFRIAFLHGCTTNEAISIINDTLLDLASSESRVEKSRTETGLLHYLHLMCMDFYRKKLRRNIKAEQLRGQNLPFQMTDILIDILRLPPDTKTPLAVHLGCGLSVEETAKITGKGRGFVTRQLHTAKKKLSKYSEAEIRESLESVMVKTDTHQRISDKFILNITEKGTGPRQSLKRFKRSLDNIVPYITIGILIFILFSFLSVHFGWFGLGV